MAVLYLQIVSESPCGQKIIYFVPFYQTHFKRMAEKAEYWADMLKTLFFCVEKKVSFKVKLLYSIVYISHLRRWLLLSQVYLQSILKLNVTHNTEDYILTYHMTQKAWIIFV